MPLTKDDVVSIWRQLISGAASIEDAACRAAGGADLQARLKDIWRGVRNELEYLDVIAPVRIERQAAGRAQKGCGASSKIASKQRDRCSPRFTEVQLMSVVTKYGVKVCLKHQFGGDFASARDFLRGKASQAAVITLIDGTVHMATAPSSFEIWFDTMKELEDFLPAVGETARA